MRPRDVRHDEYILSRRTREMRERLYNSQHRMLSVQSLVPQSLYLSQGHRIRINNYNLQGQRTSPDAESGLDAPERERLDHHDAAVARHLGTVAGTRSRGRLDLGAGYIQQRPAGIGHQFRSVTFGRADSHPRLPLWDNVPRPSRYTVTSKVQQLRVVGRRARLFKPSMSSRTSKGYSHH